MIFTKLTDNNSIENIKERISVLRDNITSQDITDNTNIQQLSNDFLSIIEIIKFNISKNALHQCLDIIKQSEYIHLLENLFSFVVYVRDIHMGLGIRTLSYHFIFTLYKSFPEFTKLFIKLILFNNEHRPFGSWRDAAGICELVYKTHSTHPLISYMITIMNETLFIDIDKCKTNIAKWIPRENSKNKWLFQALSIQWCETHHPFLLNHCKNNKSRIRAERKCFTIYRKIVSKLSRSLNITEYYLAADKNLISFNNIPINSLFKNWYHLFNTSRDMQIQDTTSKNNIDCSVNLSQSIQKYDIIHKSIPFFVDYLHFPQGIDKITTIMFNCVNIIHTYQKNNPSHDHIFITTHFKKLYENIFNLNIIWEHLFNKWKQIGQVDNNSIPVINISTTSLSNTTFHRAISRACFIAQSSNNRILFSSHIPVWINIQDCTSFYSIITQIFYSLNTELLINTSLENSISILGNPHPFTLIIINNQGYCCNYDHKPSFKDCMDIFDNTRYKKIQHSFRDNIHLINQCFQITL